MTSTSSSGYETFTPNAGRTQLTAVFPDRAEARHAINDLRALGLRLDQLSVAMRDPIQQGRLMADTGLRASDGAVSHGAQVNPKRGLRGFMAGLRTNVLPNNPSLKATDGARGPLLPGGMIGAFLFMHMSEARARGQESTYRDGSVLLTASVFEDVAEAQIIMQRHGGGMVNQANWPTAY